MKTRKLAPGEFPTFELVSNPTINLRDLRENGLDAKITDTVTGKTTTVGETFELLSEFLSKL
jgi:hypothetical protein